MLCKNCGASLPDTAGFCSNCGAQIPQPPQPQPPQQQTYTQPQPPQQQTYTPPAQQQTYAPPQPQYQQPQYQQTQYQQPQYQQPQYPQYQPQPQYPQKKKSSAGLIVLAAVLAVLLIGAVIWGVTLKKKIKTGETTTKAPRTTASQQATEQERETEAEDRTQAEGTDDPTAAPAPTQSSAGAQGNAAAGAILGKLEGYWNAASDPSAFVHFSAEQNGWAFSAGFYYSELDVYAHMDGSLEVGQYGFYHAHFSEPAAGGRAAADFDLWIDASVIDDGLISCMMCRGEPDFSRMTVMRFAGRTEDEALPPLN